MTKDIGPNFVEAALDVARAGHRRRLAAARSAMAGDRRDDGAPPIQAALVGQKKSKEALDEAQARIDQIVKG